MAIVIGVFCDCEKSELPMSTVFSREFLMVSIEEGKGD
jgi:hypothetical protein